MILRCGLLLLLLFFDCVRTTEYIYNEELIGNSFTDFYKSFSSWPSVHNGANLMRLHKRDVEVSQVGQSEGGAVEENSSKKQPEQHPPQPPAPTIDIKNPTNKIVNSNLTKVDASVSNGNKTAINSTAISNNDTKSNVTVSVKATPTQLDLNNPGVLKRGVIVFGGFALLAVAYFIFYRRKGTKNDTNTTHSANDANQFRYGVLQSEDGRDNLSRIPLTMESDEDDEDDVEIFDLGQKKKSLSYVNLQMNDEDIVLNTDNNGDNDRDENLLLDIEDKASDTLINWSSNANKSIL